MINLTNAFRARHVSPWFRRALLAGGGVFVLATLPALGYFSQGHEHYVLAGGGLILLLGVALVDIRFVPLLTVPCTLLIARAGGTSGLSASDIVLFLATFCALTVFHIRDAPEVRQLLWVLAVYQSTTILTVVDNPYRADVVEWVHEAFLVGGSLIVGWVVGRAGRAGPAVTAFVVGSCVLALWACFFSVTHHLTASNLPGGYQKNYIGDMLAFAAFLAYARPPWLRWRSTFWPRAALAICLLGILAAQSKQAIISLAVGIVFVFFRNRGLGRRSKAIFVAVVPLVIIAYVIVSDEISSSNRFNSVYARLTAYRENFAVWEHSPLVGVGLRWWYTSRFPNSIQPPNAEMELLTSAGIIGLLGLMALFAGSVAILRTVPRELGTVALAVIVMRFVQGQLDIFWVAAQGSLPWMIAGLVLGVLAVERSQAARLGTRLPLRDGASDRLLAF